VNQDFLGTFWGTILTFLLPVRIEIKNFFENWSGRGDSNPQPPTWEAEFSILYFQHLQNRLEKMCVHAMHTVHELPDLRVAGGRLGDGVSGAGWSIRTLIALI